MNRKYDADIHLFWSDEDGGYIAAVANLNHDDESILHEFVGVSAFGSTPRGALRELGVALELALEVWEEDQKGGQG